MKKQIFILSMFTLAMLFAGVRVYGQNLLNPLQECPEPGELECAAGTPLNPMPGVTETYTIDVIPNNPSLVHWIVTDVAAVYDASELTTVFDPGDGTGDYILSIESPTGVYNNPITPNVATSIDIKWKSFDGNNNNVLLVAYVVDDEDCTDNIEVWRIIPQESFTLDIEGLLATGSLGDEDCVSPIVSATYDGVTRELNVDYGEDYVYFVVTAANWMTSWQPTFDINQMTTGGTTNSVVDEIVWAYPDQATGATPVWNQPSVDVKASHYEGAEATNGFVGSDGACIVLRVHVDHTDGTVNNESLAAETVVVGIDGEMINPATNAYDDVYHDWDNGATSSDPCVNNVTDYGTFTLTPRPEVTSTIHGYTPDPLPFEPKP